MPIRHIEKTGAFTKRWADKKRWPVDEGIIPVLAQLFCGYTVYDFGAGYGEYVKRLWLNGIDATGFDAIEGVGEASGGCVNECDLGLEQYFHSADWVMSLETGEHIPPHRVSTFIQNIALHARVGIVCSWAPPGQHGTGHVSCMPRADVVAAFNQFGFSFSARMTRRLSKASSLAHIKKNIFAAVRP